MDSNSSGISSNSSGLQTSASEEDLRQVMDLRKRKRMISNRESARRSRLRKQKHLEELMAQAAQLRRQNHQILTSLRSTTQHHVSVESDNSILRAQAAELTHRLQSLAEIVALLSCSTNGGAGAADAFSPDDGAAGLVGGSWNCFSQPIVMMAAAFPPDSGLLF